jgi:hypothetical protein
MIQRSLEAARIDQSIETLQGRIDECFPERGISHLCGEFLTIVRDNRKNLSWVAKPILLLRIGVPVAMSSGAGSPLWCSISLCLIAISDGSL